MFAFAVPAARPLQFFQERASIAVSRRKTRSCHAAPQCRSEGRPYGYWKVMKNTLFELRSHLRSRATSGDRSLIDYMPTKAELIQAGRSDLAGGIERHGWSVVAREAGLPLSSIRRPRSLNLTYCTDLHLASGRMHPYMHWRNFANLQSALEKVMAENGLKSLPTAKQLIRVGRSDVMRAISIHGGWNAVSAKMGVPCVSQMRIEARGGVKTRSWERFETVAAEVRRVARVAGRARDEAPSLRELREHGQEGIWEAVRFKWGGIRQVTAVMRNGGDAVVRRVAACVDEACRLDGSRDSKAMVSREEVLELGYEDLETLLSDIGFNKVAQQCGLRV